MVLPAVLQLIKMWQRAVVAKGGSEFGLPADGGTGGVLKRYGSS